MSLRQVYSVTIYTTTPGQTVKTYVLGALPTTGHTEEDNAIIAAIALYLDASAYLISSSYQGTAGVLIDNTGILTDVDAETGGRGKSYFYRTSVARPDGTTSTGYVIAKGFEDATVAAYNSGTTYSPGDVANESGDTWISWYGGTQSGHTPSSSPSYWMKNNIPAGLVALRFALLAVAPVWTSGATFALGNWTIDDLDGQCYISLVGTNTGHQPSTSGTQWALTAMPRGLTCELIGNQAMS